MALKGTVSSLQKAVDQLQAAQKTAVDKKAEKNSGRAGADECKLRPPVSPDRSGLGSLQRREDEKAASRLAPKGDDGRFDLSVAVNERSDWRDLE
jgi:hypothetical protein